MGVYYNKRKKEWAYDFWRHKRRYTKSGFGTKKEAKQGEALRRAAVQQNQDLPSDDLTFDRLVQERLDYCKAHNTDHHYWDCYYLAQRWLSHWGDKRVRQITTDIIERYLKKIATQGKGKHLANRELVLLRALFNHSIKKKLISSNPTKGIEFFPIEKPVKYIPPQQDIDKILALADEDTRDYISAVLETLARVSEINRLQWRDVNLEERYVVLYTRKRRGGHLTPRKIPLTQTLFSILKRRHQERDKSVPWVFYHEYWSHKEGKKVVGPYRSRIHMLRSLCRKAKVKEFGFHALRHTGASLLANNNVPIFTISKILGHLSLATTEIYLHSIGESERAAMDVFEKARSNATNPKNPSSKTKEDDEGK